MDDRYTDTMVIQQEHFFFVPVPFLAAKVFSPFSS